MTEQQSVLDFFHAEKPDQVYLAAARVGGIHANNEYPASFIRDNLQIQTNVIDAAHRAGVNKLLFLGSSCIYPKMAPQPMHEDALLSGELEPTNQWYAIAKIAGIKMCQAYRRQFGFNAVCLMPTNLYGPGDNYDLENSHVLPAMMRKFHLARLASEDDLEGLAVDEKIYGRIPEDLLEAMGLVRKTSGFARESRECRMVLWGSGAPRREFLHVDDLAAASVMCMQSYDDEQILNIGFGKDIKIRELAEMVQRVVGFDGEVIWDTSRPDGTPRKLLDVERSRQLGWQAEIDLESGVRRVYEDYCAATLSRRAS